MSDRPYPKDIANHREEVCRIRTPLADADWISAAGALSTLSTSVTHPGLAGKDGKKKKLPTIPEVDRTEISSALFSART
jgi:hypothetical protein